MPKRINPIEACLDHLIKIKPNLEDKYINDVNFKLNSILPYLWKKLDGHKQFTIWPYKREDGLGFCLLLENEGLQEKENAMRNFFVIKPDGITDYYIEKGVDFKKINPEEFSGLSAIDFYNKFIGAANKRAIDKTL